MFFKPIIVGGIIGATFITLIGAHWMLLHKKKNLEKTSTFVNPAIGLETFSLSCDTPPELPLQINRNIGNISSFNEDTIPSTAEFHFETRPITIDMDPDHKTIERLMKRSRRNRAVLEFANAKGKREARSKNNVNIKRTKAITFTEPLVSQLLLLTDEKLHTS